MLRSRLRNIFLKKNLKAYNNATFALVWLKRLHFENINPSYITDNKKFWAIVSPLFCNNVKPNHKINLIKKIIIVNSDEEIAKTFKEYFDGIVLNTK